MAIPKQVESARPRGWTFRKKLLILPRFQLMLIGLNLSVVLVMTVVIWVSLRNTLSDLAPVSSLSGMEVEFYRRYLDYQASSLQTALFLAVGGGAIFSVAITLLVSHRLAGPIVRLRGYFKSIRDGAEPIPQLQFRDGDYCNELPPLINDSIDRLKEERNPEKRQKAS